MSIIILIIEAILKGAGWFYEYLSNQTWQAKQPIM